MATFDWALKDVQDRLRDYVLEVVVDDEALHEHLCRESLAYFAKHKLGMDVAELHLEWSEACSTTNRLAIQAARDHGKSAFWSYAYPIWQAWRRPGSLGVLMSSTANLAQELLDIVKHGHPGDPDAAAEGEGGGNRGLQGLLDHPLLGHLVDKACWNKREIRLTNGSVIRARGYGSRLRGGHPNWIVCDDVLDERSMYSEIQREKTKTYFRSAIVNMVLKHGQIIVVGTPFHRDDLYGYLAANPRYTFIKFPALIPDRTAPLAPDGSGRRLRALWPERHSVAELLAKKDEIGSVDFAREILCEPITDDLTLFPSSLFVGDVMASHVPMPVDPDHLRELGWTVYIGVDLAISASVGADHFRAVVLAQDHKGNKYVVDLVSAKGQSYKRQKALLIDVATKYEPEAIYVEANAYQEIFGQELIEDTDLPIVKYTTGSEKNTFSEGVPILRRMLENGKLRFARGNRRAQEKTDIIIAELQCFGFINGKLQGIGSHDDCVMALWFAVIAARRGMAFYYKATAGPAPIVSIEDEPELPPPEVRKAEEEDPEDPDIGLRLF